MNCRTAISRRGTGSRRPEVVPRPIRQGNLRLRVGGKVGSWREGFRAAGKGSGSKGWVGYGDGDKLAFGLSGYPAGKADASLPFGTR